MLGEKNIWWKTKIYEYAFWRLSEMLENSDNS